MHATARMRVQLQRQTGGRTVHFESIVLIAEDDFGVTVEALIEALRNLEGHTSIPARERSRAEMAIARALKWVETRPPAGVSGRFSKSFYLAPETPGDSWRFDIEGIKGVHLLR